MLRLGSCGFAAVRVSWALAVASAVLAEYAAAQDETVNRYITYRGEGPGPIHVIDPGGATSFVERDEIAPIILVQKAPGIPVPRAEREDELIDPAEITVILEPPAQPAEDDVDLESPEARARLEFATQQFLTERAVPKLRQTRRDLSAPLPELAEKEELALVAIASGIVQQNVPRLPARDAYGTRRLQDAVAVPDDVAEAASAVRSAFQREAVPVLPDSAQKRIDRRGYRAAKDGLSGHELRAQTPLHLLQQPPPQLPGDRRERYR